MITEKDVRAEVSYRKARGETEANALWSFVRRLIAERDEGLRRRVKARSQRDRARTEATQLRAGIAGVADLIDARTNRTTNNMFGAPVVAARLRLLLDPAPEPSPTVFVAYRCQHPGCTEPIIVGPHDDKTEARIQEHKATHSEVTP